MVFEIKTDAGTRNLRRKPRGCSPGTAIVIASHRTAVKSGPGERVSPPSPPPFPSGKGPEKGRNDLVERLMLKDGPERTDSVWRKHFAKKAGKAGRGGGGCSANVAGGGW